ncbi:AraC family transcriptional regulator ligand-binding domain-containing protein [Marinobacter koreensis]|uniref:AraC family transcriptional regulator ligand-binding domain-containing protein n=2 Tax=Bacteria TaxID=2 RepID=A0ABW0RQD1_9GAMM|nr:AraC family transcriptional regulator [Marinobacter koreensis]MCK7548634.1 AraC family transcriptional regulator [Marinobacter koreensis]
MIGSSPTVTHLYARAILQAAERQGIALSEAVIEQLVPGQRVPLTVQDQLWDEYCRASDDPLTGLDIGLGLQVGHLDSAGMLLVSCDTLREGLETLVDYAPVVGDGSEFSLSEEGALVSLCYHPGYRVRVAERVEAVMASLVRLAGWATGGAFSPERLLLGHEPLTEPAQYRERLGMSVVFGSDRHCLQFQRDQGALPLIQANSALRDHLRQLADETLAALGQQSLSGQVAYLVRTNPAWGKERVASELAVSGRHLNRLLADEGLSFKVLRERELHRLAVDLLQAGQTVTAVSERLGFSEEAAFARAFRRWEGVTPSRFRAGVC